jgi:hypothetical protein
MTTLEDVNMITFIENVYAEMHCVNISEAKFKMGEQRSLLSIMANALNLLSLWSMMPVMMLEISTLNIG